MKKSLLEIDYKIDSFLPPIGYVNWSIIYPEQKSIKDKDKDKKR